MQCAWSLRKRGDILKETPHVIFHLSYSFHRWFLYYKGDFNPSFLDNLRNKIIQFEELWTDHEETVLTLIPKYVGAPFPFKEIHVYCFENPDYYSVPCISDPVSINMTGDNLQLSLLYFIHELVHLVIQFDESFSGLSLEAQEAAAFFVGNEVLQNILGDEAHPLIELFTVPWPYDFPGIAIKYRGRINLDKNTILNLIEKGVLH